MSKTKPTQSGNLDPKALRVAHAIEALRSKQTHTPMPWTVTVHVDNSNFTSYMINEDDIAGGESNQEAEANAAYIVRAVNAHQELVSALRWIKQYTKSDSYIKAACQEALAKAEGGE